MLILGLTGWLLALYHMRRFDRLQKKVYTFFDSIVPVDEEEQKLFKDRIDRHFHL